jgi:CDP-glucose 4,6-dehydratase
MNVLNNFYNNKKILITGHTGFKGLWLTTILSIFGAKITGLSLNDKNKKNFYKCISNKSLIKSYWGNIDNFLFLKKIINKNKPQIIFHLAAQSLVMDGYKKPLKTFQTNVLGTLNVLEIAMRAPTVKSVIIVTSDKCYQNFSTSKSYKETDPLGGIDPYSSSKAAAEVISQSYLKSFYLKSKIGLATVRAGNVIGGGDWSKNRIVPDCIKSIFKNSKLILRNPNYIRPWQHVLDPLNGYLLLGMKIFFNPKKFSGPWNFGPSYKQVKSVRAVVNLIFKKSKKKIKFSILEKKIKKHESYSIKLNSFKSKQKLGWKPKYNFEASVNLTYDWYNQYFKNKKLIFFQQIKNFYKINN